MVAAVLVLVESSVVSPTVSAPDPIARSSSSTAQFHVNVSSGQVTVSGVGTSAARSRTIFAGSSIGYNSASLLDLPGNTGLKTLSVSLTNNFALPIGSDINGNQQGVQVIFSPITNLGTFPDVRNLTTVSTLAGSGTAGSVNGGDSSATFKGPVGIASAGGGTFYVADFANNEIRKISGGGVSLLAGSGTVATTNGTGVSASFKNPYGIAVAYDGSLLVTEHGGNVIRRVTTSGAVTTIAGTGVAGNTNGSGTAAKFNTPEGIATDSNGIIYVTEAGNNDVRKLVRTAGADPSLPASYTVSTLAGNGTAAETDGTGTSASFNAPLGIAVGPNGLFVADQNGNKLRSVSFTGTVATIAGSGTSGSADGIGNVATFNAPRGVAYANGNLYVAEAGSNHIRQVSPISGASVSTSQGWRTSTVAGAGTAGSTDGAGDLAKFNSPYLLASDSSGNLYVADYTNNKIREVSPDTGTFPVGVPSGTPPTEPVQLSNATGFIAGTGSGTNLPYILYSGTLAAGSTSAPQNWDFVVPSGVSSFDFNVAVQADSNQLIPPGSQVGVGDPNTLVSTLAGGLVGGFQDGNGTGAQFGGTNGIATDSQGYAYVTDAGNNCVRMISPSGQVATIAGSPLRTTFADGTGDVAGLPNLSAIVASPDGNSLYFGCDFTVRLALFSGGDKTNPQSWTVSTIAGSPGANNPITEGSGANAIFKSVNALALNNVGNLYVSDSIANNIRSMTFLGGDRSLAASWDVEDYAGSATGASGSQDGLGTAATFNFPAGIAVDANNTLFVADSQNFNIRKIVAGNVTKIAGSGVEGYQDGSTSYFFDPNSIAIDSAGSLICLGSQCHSKN